MSMNKTWAISSWISLLISADILSGDYSQYFTLPESASFALHTAMTK
jgi:purine-cytosine permease-like protein